VPQSGCGLLLHTTAVGGLQIQEFSFISAAGTLAYDLSLVLASQTGKPSIRNANIMILVYELTIV